MPRLKEQSRAWCFGCNAYKPFRVMARSEPHTEGGVTYPVTRHTATCVDCGREVSVDWVDELNYKAKVEAKAQYVRGRSAQSDRRGTETS